MTFCWNLANWLVAGILWYVFLGLYSAPLSADLSYHSLKRSRALWAHRLEQQLILGDAQQL